MVGLDGDGVAHSVGTDDGTEVTTKDATDGGIGGVHLQFIVSSDY